MHCNENLDNDRDQNYDFDGVYVKIAVKVESKSCAIVYPFNGMYSLKSGPNYPGKVWLQCPIVHNENI